MQSIQTLQVVLPFELPSEEKTGTVDHHRDRELK